MNGMYQVYQSSGKMEPNLPSSLLYLQNGPHQISRICTDGFLVINSINRQTPNPVPFFTGGSMYPKNTFRNYHVLILLRDGVLEFWHLAIPCPVYLSSIPIKGILETMQMIRIHADMKEKYMVLETNSKLIFCELIQLNHGNLDEVMDRLMTELEEDRSAINSLLKKDAMIGNGNGDCVKLGNEGVIKVDGLGLGLSSDSGSNLNPTTAKKEFLESEPLINCNMSNETRNVPRLDLLYPDCDIKFSKSPPLYVANAQWTTVAEISFPESLTCFSYSSSSRCILVSIKRKLYVVDMRKGEVVYERDVTAYTEGSLINEISFITYTQFCMMNGHAFLVFTMGSIFLFKYKMGSYVTEMNISHNETEFGVVLHSSGISNDNKLCVSDEDNWSSFVVFTTSSILVYQFCSSLSHGEYIQLVHRRDFEAVVVTGRLIEIEHQCYAVLIFENEIVVLSITSLTIIYRVSLLDLDISKKYVTFICRFI